MKALPIILVMLVVVAGAFGVMAWALLRGSAAVDAPARGATRLVDFEGELAGRWRQAHGGFTGAEAATSSDADLSAQWPSGGVVELSFPRAGRYQLTVVNSTGSGPSLDRVLHREEGRWTLAEGALFLEVEGGVLVRRHHGARSTAPVPARRRTFQLKARLAGPAGAPGASPAVTQALQLSGDCVVGPGRCEWVLSRD